VVVNGEGFAELEDVFDGSDLEKDFSCFELFSFPPTSLEFLSLAEEEAPVEVIFEKDGILYIDDSARVLDENLREKLDSNFAKLVDSVVCKETLPQGSGD